MTELTGQAGGHRCCPLLRGDQVVFNEGHSHPTRPVASPCSQPRTSKPLGAWPSWPGRPPEVPRKPNILSTMSEWLTGSWRALSICSRSSFFRRASSFSFSSRSASSRASWARRSWGEGVMQRRQLQRTSPPWEPQGPCSTQATVRLPLGLLTTGRDRPQAASPRASLHSALRACAARCPDSKATCLRGSAGTPPQEACSGLPSCRGPHHPKPHRGGSRLWTSAVPQEDRGSHAWSGYT